jgi:signal transduction histidine kinase
MLYRWLIFLACLAVSGGAMVWMSLRMLDLEDQRRATLEEAQVQEKVRLSLWRMDSLASALLIRENSRPPWHYQAFYAPDDLFASSTRSIPKGQALMPSPLFASLPEYVQLHFELVSGDIFSPQAPAGQQQEIANNWYVTQDRAAQLTAKLQALADLIKQYPEVETSPASLGGTSSPQPKPAVAVKPAAQSAEAVAKEPDRQLISNAKEQSQRADVLNRNLVAEKSGSLNAPPQKIAPALKEDSKMAFAPMTPPPVATSEKVGEPVRSASPKARESSGDVSAAGAALGIPSAEEPAAVPPQSMPALAGDLRAVWAGGELLLVRQARLEGTLRLQGVWLDWNSLRNSLLDTVRDLLPQARLIPVSPAAASSDAAALVTLPVKLVAGAVPIEGLAPGSALRPALVIAWVCLLSAALAIAFVLHRAMLLSERRAAFVSAVTHELRTPLTTFRLYSEMLAEDMVPEPEQRKAYLNTLSSEADRLMHLVENVLSYSRIERGRAAARLEILCLADFLRRLEPRLSQRAAMVELSVKLEVDPAAADQRVEIDALAVEQILLNLTDNACKYAAPDSAPRELQLQLVRERKRLGLYFRDFGPGLSRQAKKKLFQTFAKSATEAAHSAPGVGLGLALSRRLASELGATLTHEVHEGRGACFKLSFPLATADKN